MKRWRAKNRDQIHAYQKAWRETNKVRVAERQKAYHAEYRKRDSVQHTYWAKNLQRNYQMTVEEFNTLWSAQDGCCAACEIPMKPRGRSSEAVAVDHNHDTGAVRGLLCRACNHGIGQFRDDPDLLIRAADYLIERGHYAHLRTK